MKIVLMNGGLGNQLFQYAFYRYIQIATNDICYIDDSAFFGKNVEHNGFEIEKVFNIKCNLLSDFFDTDINQIQTNVAFAFRASELCEDDLRQLAEFRKVVKN